MPGETFRRTLTLELCGIAGAPFTEGTTISKTPKLFLIILCDCRFHPSAVKRSGQLPVHSPPNRRDGHRSGLTKVSYESSSLSPWSPFTVADIAIGQDVETKCLVSLGEGVQSAFMLVDGLNPGVVLGLSTRPSHESPVDSIERGQLTWHQ